MTYQIYDKYDKNFSNNNPNRKKQQPTTIYTQPHLDPGTHFSVFNLPHEVCTQFDEKTLS